MNSRISVKTILQLVALAAVLSAASLWAQSNVVEPVGQGTKPSQPPYPVIIAGAGIDYHGGSVMVNPHDVYFIWYGNWSGNSALSILPPFISGLDGSSYFNTNTSYTDGGGHSIVNSVGLISQVFDSYSQGNVLSDQGLHAVVFNQLQSGALPTDPNGIYFVLSSADVDQKGSAGEFCVDFCGFHNHANLLGADIKFAFVGNIDRCPSKCAAQIGSGPNGNPGADAMVNVMAHELNETVTDPDGNAWFDVNGLEVGDKCNFMFGPTFPANGAPADITLGGKNYLIQENWVNSGQGSCAMSLGAGTSSPTPASFTLTISLAGIGNGVVTSSPAGIMCGNGNTSCSASFSRNTLVSLTAVPAVNNQFARWDGDCAGNIPCKIPMSENHAATAVFSRIAQWWPVIQRILDSQ
jgi:Phosphate-induced protein 1 conserved region/Divergent InlB B-repeat domain